MASQIVDSEALAPSDSDDTDSPQPAEAGRVPSRAQMSTWWFPDLEGPDLTDEVVPGQHDALDLLDDYSIADIFADHDVLAPDEVASTDDTNESRPTVATPPGTDETPLSEMLADADAVPGTEITTEIRTVHGTMSIDAVLIAEDDEFDQDDGDGVRRWQVTGVAEADPKADRSDSRAGLRRASRRRRLRRRATEEALPESSASDAGEGDY